jgi:2-hydroxy-3-oxopropionate reductase
VHALGEAAVLADRSGLDLESLSPRSPAATPAAGCWKRAGTASSPRTTGRRARHMVKDLAFAEEQAGRTGVEARQLAVLLEAFRDLTEHGFGDHDIAVTRAYVASLSGSTAASP